MQPGLLQAQAIDVFWMERMQRLSRKAHRTSWKKIKYWGEMVKMGKMDAS